MKILLSAMAVLCSTLGATAQASSEPSFKLSCENSSWSHDKLVKRYCETRDLTMTAPAGQPLTVDAGPNGGITVHGWSGSDVRIRVKVQTWSATENEAAARAKRITIDTRNNILHAADPE